MSKACCKEVSIMTDPFIYPYKLVLYVAGPNGISGMTHFANASKSILIFPGKLAMIIAKEQNGDRKIEEFPIQNFTEGQKIEEN